MSSCECLGSPTLTHNGEEDEEEEDAEEYMFDEKVLFDNDDLDSDDKWGCTLLL